MAKLSAKKQELKARLNRAVVGFRIPMMSIPKLCGKLEAAIVAGQSDEELQAMVAGFPGVEIA